MRVLRAQRETFLFLEHEIQNLPRDALDVSFDGGKEN